jgi:hypothetical protein
MSWTELSVPTTRFKPTTPSGCGPADLRRNFISGGFNHLGGSAQIPVEMGVHTCMGISVCAVAKLMAKTRNNKTVSSGKQVRRIMEIGFRHDCVAVSRLTNGYSDKSFSSATRVQYLNVPAVYPAIRKLLAA